MDAKHTSDFDLKHPWQSKLKEIPWPKPKPKPSSSQPERKFPVPSAPDFDDLDWFKTLPYHIGTTERPRSMDALDLILEDERANKKPKNSGKDEEVDPFDEEFKTLPASARHSSSIVDTDTTVWRSKYPGPNFGLTRAEIDARLRSETVMRQQLESKLDLAPSAKVTGKRKLDPPQLIARPVSHSNSHSHSHSSADSWTHGIKEKRAKFV